MRWDIRYNTTLDVGEEYANNREGNLGDKPALVLFECSLCETTNFPLISYQNYRVSRDSKTIYVVTHSSDHHVTAPAKYRDILSYRPQYTMYFVNLTAASTFAGLSRLG